VGGGEVLYRISKYNRDWVSRGISSKPTASPPGGNRVQIRRAKINVIANKNPLPSNVQVPFCVLSTFSISYPGHFIMP
jgi:hypothetical protein